ncbi:MAG: hypothetical protein AABN34_02085 [Acidobacteriota bacterium]
MNQRAPMRSFNSRLHVVVLASVVLLTVTAWSASGRRGVETIVTPRQQAEVVGQKRKVVDQGITYQNQPVELVDLQINGKAANLSRGINADTEWLKGLSFKVKNLSKKRILKIDLFLIFPDTESNGGRLLICPMHYGVGLNDPGNVQGVEPLKQNETAAFGVSDELYTELKRHLEERIPLGNVKHVRISLELIVFDDDTAWGSGQEMRRDPNNPRRWIPIE